MQIQLFFAPNSCAFAALIALEQANASYKPIKLDLTRGEQKSEDFLLVNPRGQVPVLVADETIITQLIGILTFIAHRFPEANILPLSDPLALAKAFELLAWFSTTVHVHIAQIFRANRFSDDLDVQNKLKDPGIKKFNDELILFESLADRNRRWLTGDTFTAIDSISLVCWRWAKKLELDLSIYGAWTEMTERAMQQSQVLRAIDIEQLSDKNLLQTT